MPSCLIIPWLLVLPLLQHNMFWHNKTRIGSKPSEHTSVWSLQDFRNGNDPEMLLPCRTFVPSVVKTCLMKMVSEVKILGKPCVSTYYGVVLLVVHSNCSKEAGEIIKNESGEKWDMGGFGPRVGCPVWCDAPMSFWTSHTGKLLRTFQSFGRPKFNLGWNKLDQAVDMYPFLLGTRVLGHCLII